MTKRFIVILHSATDEQNEAFLAWLREKKLGWWHWFQGSWLLATNSDSWTAAQVRDIVREKFSDVHHIVFELHEGEGTWSGYGPKGENNNMFSWINDNWK